MSLWTRTSGLDAPKARQNERWEYFPRGGGDSKRFEVAVTTGKRFDVLSLKAVDLDGILSYAAFLKGMAAQLYKAGAPRRRIGNCPCCGADTSSAPETGRFFGVPYHRCLDCGHGFIREQPTEEALNSVFAGSEEHAAAYTEAASAETRIEQIIKPKIDWTLGTYRAHHHRAPDKVIDVGAGGGHFVEGLRREGVSCEGYELSAASRDFAREAFGIELRGEDFLAAAGDPADLVTFWGLLEYTPAPRRFLEAARRRLAPGAGMLVVEAPRFDCLGTVAQILNPETIARHMDPTSHVNCFSDASLATLMVETGFRPVAAWYFGMDAYELLVQCCLRLDAGQALGKLADMIPALQDSLDQGRQCDDIVIAAVPAD